MVVQEESAQQKRERSSHRTDFPDIEEKDSRHILTLKIDSSAEERKVFWGSP